MVFPDTLSCDAARETLWPLDQPRPYSERDEGARIHLGHCPECREYFARDAALARAIARHGAGGHAPDSLRRRIADATARETRPEATSARGRATVDERHPAGRMREIFLAARIRREGLAIAAVLAALLAGAALLRSGPGEGIGEAYAQDFLNRAIQDHAIHAPDPATVSRYFLREIGIGVRPVMLEEGRLTRAMVCLLKKRRAAMVEYAIGDQIVAHYRIPNEPGEPTGELPQQSRSERGVNIVTWRDATFEHALVSNLSIEELSALARSAFAEG